MSYGNETYQNEEPLSSRGTSRGTHFQTDAVFMGDSTPVGHENSPGETPTANTLMIASRLAHIRNGDQNQAQPQATNNIQFD